MNNRAKGTLMERLALEEFKQRQNKLYSGIYQTDSEIKPMREWRSIANKFNNTDFLGDFDFAVLYGNTRIHRGIRLFMVQVKSKYSTELMTNIKKRWSFLSYNIVQCYLAVYGHEPQTDVAFKTESFYWIRI
jgi:hypothetical protein